VLRREKEDGMMQNNKAGFAVIVSALVALAADARADIVIETVTVGDPGNLPDNEVMWRDGTTGYGSVWYTYDIGKYEVTNGQYAEFLNAVATVGDPYGLYNTDMSSGWNDIGGISRTGSGTAGDPWAYAARPGRANRPVNYVSWYDALRFANWLQNGQPVGGQDASTTEDGSYDMSLGYSVVRKQWTGVFLTSEDEWYKAAYYKGGGLAAGYWDYPTQSDTAPTSEPPPGTDMTHGSANYFHGGHVNLPYFTTEVGAYSSKPSTSAYGTFDQGGNLFEWNEDKLPWGLQPEGGGMRGGSFDFPGNGLPACDRGSSDATSERAWLGFRLAYVPEPATFSLLGLGGLACLSWRR
jgi:formylglycine-generating enzyme required for sulfatase activity